MLQAFRFQPVHVLRPYRYPAHGAGGGGGGTRKEQNQRQITTYAICTHTMRAHIWVDDECTNVCARPAINSFVRPVGRRPHGKPILCEKTFH